MNKHKFLALVVGWLIIVAGAVLCYIAYLCRFSYGYNLIYSVALFIIGLAFVYILPYKVGKYILKIKTA